MKDDYFSLIQALAPDLAVQIEKRAFVLERIGTLQPIGRRQLAAKMNMAEREVRTVAALLKEDGLINLDAAGMTLTERAVQILPAAEKFSRELRGLTSLEMHISELLKVETVCVVPGDADSDIQVLNEVGKSAAQHLRAYLNGGSTLAVTGGSTIHEVAVSLPQGSAMDVMVVPARGAFGRSLESEANTIASEIAKRLGGHLRFMYVPDQLDEDALHEIRRVRDVEETLTLLESADVVLHGIGRLDEMAHKRRLPQEVEKRLLENHVVGEAFGCYFSIEGNTVYGASTVSQDLGILKPDCAYIAVAAGSRKAEAIIGAMRNHPHALLVTDEGAAKEILRLEKNYACTPEGILQ